MRMQIAAANIAAAKRAYERQKAAAVKVRLSADESLFPSRMSRRARRECFGAGGTRDWTSSVIG
ncbi:hypothetical protein BZM26_31605 [Paraburkholderia strydomiana]|nr:hypothetical protein BZM26_31605 [Paraburkholderia strydomiana]